MADAFSVIERVLADAAVPYSVNVAQAVLQAVRDDGWVLSRCTCGNEGRHARLHPDDCQVSKDYWQSKRRQGASDV